LNSSTIDGEPFNELISKYVLKIGENIVPGQLDLLQDSGDVTEYIHSNAKIGVLVQFSGSVDSEVGHDIAMHVAAAAPRFVRPEEVESAELEQEKQIIRKQCLDEGKPEAIVEKITEGKIAKFYKEVCLLEQAFIKDTDKAVKDTLPEGVTITAFKRYSLV